VKILFAHNNADLYGSSRSMLRLSSRLMADGHSVSVVLPFDGSLGNEMRTVGANVYIQPDLAVFSGRIFKSPMNLLGFIVRFPVSLCRLIRLIRQVKPDVVHSNTSVVLTPGLAARLCRIPHVWHIRENYSEYRFFWRFYQHYMAVCSSAIVCVSRSIQEQFAGNIQLTKTHVIHNGFPAEEFKPVEPERIRAFRDHFHLGDARLAGLIGRINIKRKGQNLLVDAVGRLNGRYPDVKFLIIGSVFPGNEWQLEELKRQMESLGVQDRMVMTGDVEDIKAAYASLDIVLMVSELPEAFSGVVIEGMAMGKPVIGTDVGGTAEQIDPGETGLLIAPRDSRALAGALERLLSSRELVDRLGRNARRRFLTHYELEPFFHRIADIYSRLVAVNKNRG
jgi:glycosyltransferase involved in cell wall biosynthesis